LSIKEKQIPNPNTALAGFPVSRISKAVKQKKHVPSYRAVYLRLVVVFVVVLLPSFRLSLALITQSHA
jgi:hypothetical protein